MKLSNLQIGSTFSLATSPDNVLTYTGTKFDKDKGLLYTYTNGVNKIETSNNYIVIPSFRGTTGKWLIEENVSHYPFIMGEDNNTIAMLFEKDGSLLYGRTYEETQANAKLIASAPDMLTMLKAVKQYGEENGMEFNLFQNLARVIAKAE